MSSSEIFLPLNSPSYSQNYEVQQIQCQWDRSRTYTNQFLWEGRYTILLVSIIRSDAESLLKALTILQLTSTTIPCTTCLYYAVIPNTLRSTVQPPSPSSNIELTVSSNILVANATSSLQEHIRAASSANKHALSDSTRKCTCVYRLLAIFSLKASYISGDTYISKWYI